MTQGMVKIFGINFVVNQFCLNLKHHQDLFVNQHLNETRVVDEPMILFFQISMDYFHYHHLPVRYPEEN